MARRALSIAQRRPPQDLRPNASRRGYDRAWRKLRNAHLKANPICVGCQRLAAMVDHVQPIAMAPHRRLDPTNLRSLCLECHGKVTSNYRRTGRNEL